MDLERAAIHHECNVIRRKVQAERADVSIIFVLHEGDDFSETIEKQSYAFNRYPVGTKMRSVCLDMRDPVYTHHQFCAVGMWTERRWYWPIPKHQYLMVCAINITDLERIEDVRICAWNGIFHGLKLINTIKETAPNSKEASVIRQQHKDSIDLARQNMNADVFAAIMLSQNGQRNAVEILGKNRCQFVFKKRVHHYPEYYIYPVVVDILRVIVQEYKDFEILKTKVTPLAYALDVAQEVDLSFDEQAIVQWQNFARSAQHMLWLEESRNTILQAAMYTSEDPYIRSMAYLVADFLNSNPPVKTDFGVYNPFTEGEVNERAHRKACEAMLSQIVGAVRKSDIQEHIQHQMDRMTGGRVLGWCVPGLLAVCDHMTEDGEHITKTQREEIFRDGNAPYNWAFLSSYADATFDMRRAGQSWTQDALEQQSHDNPCFSFLKNL